MTRHLTLLAALALSLILTAGCGSDSNTDGLTAVKLVTETRTDAMSLPGQAVAATVDTTTLWLSDDLARRDTGNGTFLVSADGRLTQVDHASRTYTSRTTGEVGRMFAALAADTAGNAAARTELDRLKSLLKVAARVTDTGEDAEVDGYRCRRWIVEQRYGEQHMTTEVWLTGEIELDFGLLHRATRPALRALPGGPEALAELSRLQGVPVRSTALLRLMNRKGRTESRLLSVETVPVASSFFAPPAGYRSADVPPSE